MATFNDVGSGSISNFRNLLGAVTINNFNNLVRGMLFEMLSSHVNNFNLMNYDYMNIHMFRNAYEREITLNTVGENAYPNGNSDNMGTPAQNPSYIGANNYMQFVTNTRIGEKNGELTTRLQKAGEENTNYYLDFDNGEDQVRFTGSYLDRNSILYKTKRLMNQNKIKTIITKYYTEGVEYNGQVGSKYGESHGRNLLRKQAETGANDNKDDYKYDNPYCRVWTHQHKYDTIRKTMRANSGAMNTWSNFEWTESDKGHGKDATKYGEGENYDYAWRGKHNQDRREAHSALDTKTGLVKMTPQYRGGVEDDRRNRHTKDCMFSIENLAWKDYDPYSFEQALSWEQRGPLGGRIMWFPPYGLEIQETANAKWQSNDFIGRGEPVYTYVNSERNGNLSFLMITDHPSSIDYASWWDDNEMITNASDGSGNSENDYLRYFAGCGENGSSGTPGGSDGNPDGNGKTGGLIIKPTPMTDEYTKEPPPPLIQGGKGSSIAISPSQNAVGDKSPEYVEFFVFFPNNYSGVWDKPTNQKSEVNAIAYLLGGSNTCKKNQIDIPFDVSSTGFKIGYEMEKGPVTTSDVVESNEYIQGGKLTTPVYVPDPDKKWCYRIDHIQLDGKKPPYKGGNNDPKNTINQKIEPRNLKDTKTNKTNLAVNSDVKDLAVHKNNLYSFAEVAAALYSETILNQPNLYKYLVDCGVNTNKVDKLVKLFTNSNQKLTEVFCQGAASSHGSTDRNEALSTNRANTILDWLHTNTVCGWENLKNSWDGKPKIIPVEEQDKLNVNGVSAKLGRCAHCIMTFTSGFTESSTKPSDGSAASDDNLPEHIEYLGFEWKRQELKSDGTIWNYYKKTDSTVYFEQVAQNTDNYEDSTREDVTIDKNQILQIFLSDDHCNPGKIDSVKTRSDYRGVYNEFGIFLNNHDYSGEDDNLKIVKFVEQTENRFTAGDYIYRKCRFYLVNTPFTATIWSDMFLELSWIKDVTNYTESYSKGDIVYHGENYFVCKNNYSESHADYTFDENDWEELNITNIREAIKPAYRYRQVGDRPYREKDIISYRESEEGPARFAIIAKRYLIPNPGYNFDKWEMLDVDVYEEASEGDVWNTGDYVTYGEEEDLYKCNTDGTPYTAEFDESRWGLVDTVYFSDLEDSFKTGQIVEYTDGFYKALVDMPRYEYSYDLKPALSRLICRTNDDGEFDGNYAYDEGDFCKHDGKYYKSKTDFSEKDRAEIPFDSSENGDWEQAGDDVLYSYVYSFTQSNLVRKSAAVLCYTVPAMIKEITGEADTTFDDDETYSCIWKYGTTNGLMDGVDTATDLYNYAKGLEEASRSGSMVESPKIRFSADEENFLTALVSSMGGEVTLEELRTCIILYRILDGVSKVNDTEGTRNVCETAPDKEEDMVAKTKRNDASVTDRDECKDSLWIDRSDGLLIQECNIDREGKDVSIERFNATKGEGEWNKLRYDQEYHFYKQWILEHPLMYERLQEKVKYFNPAFHSMTPEGFNARCTFLQQCTRQGNTKTMSDLGGKTANNLAFGRPPYCVLRLGDFYNQLIVIENVNFEYGVSDGIQWDLNTEGNGVQPMLCRVNISFKFIGGGDITGPVQRLQNAMSFNYYANASFYDNRADRAEYQTDWKTMGGAGNNEINTENSYAFIAQNYEKPQKNIVKPTL